MANIQESRLVLIEQAGPPDVLKYQTQTLQPPGPGHVLINQKAIGVNFVDVFLRNGTFPLNAYPAPIGLEASGVIDEVGGSVKEFAVGDRVAYYASQGAYVEKGCLAPTNCLNYRPISRSGRPPL